MKIKKGPARARDLLTIWEYKMILNEQEGVCAICNRLPRKRRLAVDHNHKTGMVRGLLCHRCNRGLKWFGDKWFLMDKASEYLWYAHTRQKEWYGKPTQVPFNPKYPNSKPWARLNK